MRSFAFKTLLADRRKLLIALTGVVFSLVLVNIQGGMFLGMIRKSTLLIDHSAADIWVGHRGVTNADITADIPVSWLNRVRGIPAVAQAEPYIVSSAMLRLPDGDFEGVLVVGYEPVRELGRPWAFVSGSDDCLHRPDAITIDRLDEPRLAGAQVGDLLEINGRRARVAGKTDSIVGFITTPYVFTKLERARQYTNLAADRCSYILVRSQPHADPADVVREIERRVPDADVYLASEFSHKTRRYWILRTGLGMSFGGAILLGLAVGLVMVAQSLYAFVLDHLEDYAVLKAMGASERQLRSVLLLQGVAIAVIGCVGGHLVSLLLCWLISSPRLTIVFTPELLLLSTTLATTICVVSSWIPFGRVRRVDPVAVLQG